MASIKGSVFFGREADPAPKGFSVQAGRWPDEDAQREPGGHAEGKGAYASRRHAMNSRRAARCLCGEERRAYPVNSPGLLESQSEKLIRRLRDESNYGFRFVENCRGVNGRRGEEVPHFLRGPPPSRRFPIIRYGPNSGPSLLKASPNRRIPASSTASKNCHHHLFHRVQTCGHPWGLGGRDFFFGFN